MLSEYLNKQTQHPRRPSWQLFLGDVQKTMNNTCSHAVTDLGDKMIAIAIRSNKKNRFDMVFILTHLMQTAFQ